jgi:hypothetical protein
MINEYSFKNLYNYYKFNDKTLLKECINEICNTILNGSVIKWNMKRKLKIILNFYKNICIKEYYNYLYLNINKICKIINNKDIDLLVLKYRLINLQENCPNKLYKQIKIYYNDKYSIQKKIINMPISIELMISLYKIIYRSKKCYHCYIKTVIKTLKYKFKLNDEEINYYL